MSAAGSLVVEENACFQVMNGEFVADDDEEEYDDDKLASEDEK